MTLPEIENFYKNEITNNMDIHKESGIEALDYLDHSTAKYHGKTIYSLYVPKILNVETTQIFKQIAETMAAIMQKVIREYQKNAKYRSLFGFSGRIEVMK